MPKQGWLLRPSLWNSPVFVFRVISGRFKITRVMGIEY